jgi:cyclin H
MIEDEIYRSSTQFRQWSFTKDSLNSLRANTNAVASGRIRAAQRRAREAHRSGTPSSAGISTPNRSDVEGKDQSAVEKDIICLTTEEEVEFVQYYCEKTLELGDLYKPPLPTMVRVSGRPPPLKTWKLLY